MTARPPLAAIFTFCTAARFGSFKLAADEMSVTPGAVSRQIHALEEYLGHKLFERSPRSIRLTDKGAQLQELVSDKMMSISAEVNLLRSGGRKKTICLDAGVTVAMHWLIPRLTSFTAEAGVQVHISTSDGPIDLNRRMDLYIRRNPSEFRGLKHTKFLDEHSVLVASPKLMRSAKTCSPDAMTHFTRIGAKTRSDLWKQWSAYHQLLPTEFEPTLEFDNTVLAIQATVEGLGVMVVPEMFITNVLNNRLLVPLDSTRIPTGTYSYATPPKRDSNVVTGFTDWLHQSQ